MVKNGLDNDNCFDGLVNVCALPTLLFVFELRLRCNISTCYIFFFVLPTNLFFSFYLMFIFVFVFIFIFISIFFIFIFTFTSTFTFTSININVIRTIIINMRFEVEVFGICCTKKLINIAYLRPYSPSVNHLEKQLKKIFYPGVI